MNGNIEEVVIFMTFFGWKMHLRLILWILQILKISKILESISIHLAS